jgi:acetoin utilization protein AcuB
MYIKDWMTRDPIVVSPDTPILEAQKIMRENRIRRLPVLDHGKLVGIVTYRDLIEASPSDATSLSIHELNYLLSKLKIKDVMTADPVVAGPDETVEQAALRGTEKGVGALPVVHEGKLIGIATVADLFRIVMTVLGAREDLQRITLQDVDVGQGTLQTICQIVESAGGVMVTVVSIPQKASDLRMVVIRARDISYKTLEKSLKDKGFTIHR